MTPGNPKICVTLPMSMAMASVAVNTLVGSKSQGRGHDGRGEERPGGALGGAVPVRWPLDA
jgi:hypothetical protein